MKGVHGENLLILLESRLDNIVYRIGLLLLEEEQDNLLTMVILLLMVRK